MTGTIDGRSNVSGEDVVALRLPLSWAKSRPMACTPQLESGERLLGQFVIDVAKATSVATLSDILVACHQAGLRLKDERETRGGD